MLTRFVRTQLIIFSIASIVGVAVMVAGYMQIPVLLGIGRITVTLDLPATGGLYRFANVTYRGVQVGKVTDVDLRSGSRVKATLSLNNSPKIPENLRADVRSISAVGEQYVDLQPAEDKPPYLHDGSVIVVDSSGIPQPIGPVLDQASALLNSIPKDRVTGLVDEAFNGLNGAGFDLSSLLDSGSAISQDLRTAADPTRSLIDDAAPFLDAQTATADATRAWSHGLAEITEQLRANDPQLRTILRAGPGAAQEITRLLDQLKPTLPILLANLTTIGQIAVTYNPSLEQLLVLTPPMISTIQAALPRNNPTGLALGEFTLATSDPPACTVGFLPPSAWRSPADTTTIDTPDGLYCKLPQDSPIGVRGARNAPCMDHPGKRAPTIEICHSDKPFEPLATRQHALGPYPIDPNLIAQGVPPDQRAENNDNIFAPVEGTPMPGGAPPLDATVSTAVTPSAYSPAATNTPRIAIAQYNPQTGTYIGDDGKLYRQAELIENGAPDSWRALLPH